MGKIKLFCFPYAGNSAMVYWPWKKYLHPSIELSPKELAGRGKRIKDPFNNSMDEAVTDIYNSIQNELHCNYAIFGHSLGCILAYEIVYRIVELNKKPPLHVFLSGRNPPHKQDVNRRVHTMSEKEIIYKLMTIGGTPVNFFTDKNLLACYLPIIRSDYTLIETYTHKKERNPLDVDISIFYGNNDQQTTESSLHEWKNYTTKECRFYEFPGNHFFIHSSVVKVTQTINDILLMYI